MERHEAIVLRRRNVREADRLVTLLSPTAGKRDVLVRGARKQLSKLSASLEPFSHVQVELVLGRRATHAIGVAVLDPFRRLRTSLPALAQAWYAVEVADALTRNDQADARLFRLLRTELARVDRAATRGSVAAVDSLALALFTLRAIALAGWRPDLAHCSVCHRTLGNSPAVFAAHPFGLAHPQCLRSASAPPVSPVTRRYLQRRLTTVSRGVVVPRAVFREVGQVALAAVETVIDRRLSSRRLLRLLIRR